MRYRTVPAGGVVIDGGIDFNDPPDQRLRLALIVLSCIMKTQRIK